MELSSQSAATTKVDRFFRHPLTLSIVGALLGSLLIPWVAGRANKQAVLAETRVKQAVEIMTTSNSVNVMLNKLKTEFESFEKDSLSTASRGLSEATGRIAPADIPALRRIQRRRVVVDMERVQSSSNSATSRSNGP